LKETFSVEPQLIEGGGGEFEITVDGKLVFSKKSTKRFPDKGEVEQLIQGL